MNGSEDYLETARAYSDGVRVLFAPTGAAAGDRGRLGPASYSDLAGQAGELLPMSGRLTQAAVGRMAEAPAEARAESEVALLAKALTDLEVSGYLYQAAREQEAGSRWSEAATGDRSRGLSRTAEPYLALLLGEPEAPESEERGPGEPRNVAAARQELLTGSSTAFHLISQRAAGTSELALERLLAIGLGELAGAVATVGMELAEVVGVAEKVSELYELFRGFLDKAMASLFALLGPKLAKTVAQEAGKWAKKLDLGEHIGTLTELLYQTQESKAVLRPVIESAEADLDTFVTVIKQVGGLNEKYRKQTELVDTILDKLRWVAMIPKAALPKVHLVLAALYLVLGGYVIFLGADYVDAPRVSWLDRVPGVRRVVETSLGAPQGG
jgi:hypothetical protein